MAQLDDILKTFGEVRRVGASGEHLASETKEMLRHMDFLIEEFETGMQSEVWVQNFTLFGGEEMLVWAEALYTELKTTRAKLTELGL